MVVLFPQAYCATPWPVLLNRFKKGLYPNAKESRVRMQCFKSAYMAAVLHDGLGFPRRNIKLTTTQQVDGKEVGWTLGAMVYKTRYFPLRSVTLLSTVCSLSLSFISRCLSLSLFLALSLSHVYLFSLCISLYLCMSLFC